MELNAKIKKIFREYGRQGGLKLKSEKGSSYYSQIGKLGAKKRYEKNKSRKQIPGTDTGTK